MKVQIAILAREEDANKINPEELEQLLSEEEVPEFLLPLYVGITVRNDDWYPQEVTREENGDVNMTLLFSWDEFCGDVQQLILDRFRVYVAELKEEDVRMEV